MKVTKHNGRSGKHGSYNPKHNDRQFDVEKSEHIDAERMFDNVYWDYQRGYRHPERQRAIEDLYKNDKTCPEESIYQIL